MLHYGSPSELSCTLMSYIAPYWATLQPPELRCALFWAPLHPVELRCILLSYAAFNWAMLHPIWAILHPIWATLRLKSYASSSELSCALLSYAALFWAMLHPSELCCILLSYAVPFRASLHTTELGLTLNELHGTLKINGPAPSIAASLILLTNDIQRKPREISRNKCISSGPNSGCQGHISFHCTTETYIENRPRKITVWAPVYVLTFFLFYSFFINIMSPALPSQLRWSLRRYYW
jgi:hypothetical protein